MLFRGSGRGSLTERGHAHRGSLALHCLRHVRTLVKSVVAHLHGGGGEATSDGAASCVPIPYASTHLRHRIFHVADEAQPRLTVQQELAQADVIPFERDPKRHGAFAYSGDVDNIAIGCKSTFVLAIKHVYGLHICLGILEFGEHQDVSPTVEDKKHRSGLLHANHHAPWLFNGDLKAAEKCVQMTQGETLGSRELLAIAFRDVRLPCGR